MGVGMAGHPVTTVFASGPSLVEEGGGSDNTPSPRFQARFGLVGTRREEGNIQLAWHDARTALDRDMEIAIELFCDYVIGAYERVRSRVRPIRPLETSTSRNLDLPPH
jgi:hypothetical protein